MDMLAESIDPAAGQQFRDRRVPLAWAARAQVTQPGETLQMIAERRRYFAWAEVEAFDRDALALPQDLAVEHRAAEPDHAFDRVGRHFVELERMAAAQAQAMNRGAPGKRMKAPGKPFGERVALVMLDTCLLYTSPSPRD